MQPTANKRPRRLYIPLDVRREAARLQGGYCTCGCGTPCWEDEKETKALVEWDHHPALRLRDLNRRKTDYVPAQLDPRYLVGRCKDSHSRKTRGTGATTAGTDTGAITKERKRNRRPKPKKRIPSRPMQSCGKTWPKRQMQSRPFQKSKT